LLKSEKDLFLIKLEKTNDNKNSEEIIEETNDKNENKVETNDDFIEIEKKKEETLDIIKEDI
jgi:hypothetical protein